MKMKKYISMLIYQCVLTLVLCGTVIHADKLQVTNVDIPADTKAQTHVDPTASSVQDKETVSTVQNSETNIISTSLTTSLPVDQSESSSIKEGTHSSTLVEPSFSEIHGTSQTEQFASETVIQSTSVVQSDAVLESTDKDVSSESKKSVEDTVPDPAAEEHQKTVKADDTEVKVTEKVEDTVTAEVTKETEPSKNITQYKETEDQGNEVVTEPSVNTPSAPSGDEPKVGAEQPDVGGEKTGVDGETGEVPGEEKQEEEGLTFNEWTLRVLAEAEKGKQEAQQDTRNFQLPPVKQRKKKNYASQECGAKILANNPEASSPKSVLNSNRDEYMNNPCKTKKWFVIELCEPIQSHSVDIASLELFSSQPKKFRLLLSDRYPTKDWKLVGEFDLKDERTVQTLPISEAQDYFAKFVRVELVEHYGDEHFCPLTIFRILGIAVNEFEEDHHDNVDDDNDDDDDDENNEGEAEEGSKNLFTSAKDTVINIVKKVLNVESEGEKLINNASQVNVTSDGDSALMNGTTGSQPGDTLPCVPDANIVADKDELCADKKVNGHTDDILPQSATPGKTDSVIVVKLKDDEQVETTPDITPGKPLDAHNKDCFLAMLTFARLKKQHSIVHSNLCEFVYMIKQQSPVHSRFTMKKEKGASKVIEDEGSKVVASTDQISIDKQEISASVTADITPVKSANPVSIVTGTGAESSASSSAEFVQVNKISESKHISESSPAKEKSKLAETVEVTVSTTSKLIQPTLTEDVSSLTGTQVVSSSQTVDRVSTKQSGSMTSSALEQSATSESQKIDPSPTSVQMPRENTVDTTREATPVLPESWKPDTKDLMPDKTSTETQLASDSTSKQTPVPPSVSISPGETTLTTTTATINTPSNDLPQQMDPTDLGQNGGSLDEVQDELGTVDTETGEETQEQRPNTTVIDEKVVVGNGGQQKRENLGLVRVPVIPSSKRESAIMRLSNRIKVLEQNVSLSSRFLEELSRRYKKQSEDMMKMLNKTMATVQNMTVEADVKNKLHEDEMTAMEQRLENLTQIMHKLTHNFENLNRQVIDRQLIWTTVTVVLIVMLLFFHFRRQKVTLPPEVKSMIESMPSKPATSLHQRRNSLSGPATPSKERSFGNLHSGGGLQRFSSETALGSTDKDFTIVHPIITSFKQGTDVKKKKKKKPKNLEGRLFGGPVQWHNESIQSFNHQSASNSNQSKETSLQPYDYVTETSQCSVNKGNQSKETSLHSSCSLTQTESGCFGSLLSGWSNSTTAKQRSASLGTGVDLAPISTQAGGTFHQGVQEGTKEGLGTKNWTKGLAKKPPVSGASKLSPKLNMKNPKGSEKEGWSKRPEMTLEEKWVVRGHRRQKSLPKQHYSIETVGHTSHESANPGGLQRTVTHSDTTPILHKAPKNKEMKKSVSLPLSSESNGEKLPNSTDHFEKPPTCSYSFTNGHSEYNGGLLDTGQTENCYSLEKSKSEVFFASKYGKNMYKDDFVLNGHTNGEDCNENARSGARFTSLGCDKIEYSRPSLKPLVIDRPDSIKARQNGTWKGIFGYFK